MPITPPTYGILYDQTEQNTNMDAVVTAITAAMAANVQSLVAARVALHEYVNSVQFLLRKMIEAHHGSGLFPELEGLLQSSESCAEALVAATT